MNNSLVSVVIPTYNRATIIARTIQSILSQTYREFEIIVADDGSNDSTPDVITNLFKQNRQIVYLHQKHSGAQAARNMGIRAAKGEWIAFLDSDDLWLPQSLKVRLELARKEKVKVVYSQYLVFKENGVNMELSNIHPLSGWIYQDLLKKSGPVFQTLLVKNQAFRKIGYLDETIKAWQEWDTAIRLAKYYKFGFVKEPTFIYDRRRNDTISKDILRGARGYEQVIHKHFISILRNAGSKAMSQHYKEIASRYKRGNSKNAASLRNIIANFFSYLNYEPEIRKKS